MGLRLKIQDDDDDNNDEQAEDEGVMTNLVGGIFDGSLP